MFNIDYNLFLQLLKENKLKKWKFIESKNKEFGNYYFEVEFKNIADSVRYINKNSLSPGSKK
jgi:hypothetical protein